MKIKELFTRRTIVMCGIAFVLALVLCIDTVPPITLRWMSAEQTVAYYFNQCNARNVQGMQSVYYRTITGGIEDYGLPLEYARLISCEERSKETVARLFPEKWLNSHAYDLAVYWVTYEVWHWDGNQRSVDWRSSYDFYLVKETKYSNWVIVMWGQA